MREGAEEDGGASVGHRECRSRGRGRRLITNDKGIVQVYNRPLRNVIGERHRAQVVSGDFYKCSILAISKADLTPVARKFVRMCGRGIRSSYAPGASSNTGFLMASICELPQRT